MKSLTKRPITKQLMSSNIVFQPIERDSVICANGVVASPQKKSYNLKGFNGKTVNKVLICKSSLDGKTISMKNDDEKVNFIVNGRQILPYDGIDTPAKKVAFLNDSWGVVNMLPGMNIPQYDASNAVGYTVPQVCDFIGLGIGDNIDDFQLEYTRTPSTANKADMNLLVYGEVNKVLQANGGDYQISYV